MVFGPGSGVTKLRSHCAWSGRSKSAGGGREAASADTASEVGGESEAGSVSTGGSRVQIATALGAGEQPPGGSTRSGLSGVQHASVGEAEAEVSSPGGEGIGTGVGTSETGGESVGARRALSEGADSVSAAGGSAFEEARAGAAEVAGNGGACGAGRLRPKSWSSGGWSVP